MASFLASDVMDLASGAYLNDPLKTTFTYVNMLPLVQSAVLSLESKLAANGIGTLDVETAVLAITAVTGIAISSASAPALPTDLVMPIALEERPTGSGDLFSPMREVEHLPERRQGNTLSEWCWEDETIKLVGSLVATDVRIEYQKQMAVITASASPIYALGSKLYLALKTASLAAMIIGRNTERAGFLDNMANTELSLYIGTRIKEAQGHPDRRLPYGYYRRIGRRMQTRSGR